MANNKQICINLAELIRKTIYKLFPEYSAVSISDHLSLDRLNGTISGDTVNDQQLFSLLFRIRKLWNSATLDYPSKAGTGYLGRLNYWVRDSQKPDSQKTLALVPYCNTLIICNITKINTRPNDKLLDLQVEVNIENSITRLCINAVDMRDIIPLFNTYSGHFYTIIEYLMEYTQRHLNGVTVDIKDNVEFVGKTEYTETKQPIQEQENKIMNKTMTNATQVVSNSISVATNITTGNATNAAVKAILRPVLEPTLRKLLEPKGLIQRTLGKSKVEDNITLLMDSPLMDVVSAAVLVSLTSSGLIKNDKLVKGASFASDAALVKLLGLIDFDQVSNALTSKISEVVSKLDNTDSKI